MADSEIVWLAERLEEKSHWLFYGEFEPALDAFLAGFSKGFMPAASVEALPLAFRVAYWSVLSELVALDFVDYGTSPRVPFWTEDGERFIAIIKSNYRAIRDAEDYTHLEYNPDDTD